MSIFKAKTTASNQVWKSPDGQRVIFEVYLETPEGPAKAKCYSQVIAAVGFEGEVETYEKSGKQGPETFVKQAPKEDAPSYAGGSKKEYSPKGDAFTMYLSYAKDLMVALLNNGAKIDYPTALQMVVGGGYELYEARPDAPPKPEPTTDVLTSVDEDLNQQLDDAFSVFGVK